VKIALLNGRFDKDKYKTVRDAIGDLEDVDQFTIWQMIHRKLS